jgi:ethanolamine utilization cobalamin adenosyltransferase
MPLLREILTMANDKTHNLMRAKALECISLVGMSIGKERFREDAHQVLQYMQSLQVHFPPPSTTRRLPTLPLTPLCTTTLSAPASLPALLGTPP